MFGEIDCREGLTMAVDKLKYETVDAAMDVLLTIYKGIQNSLTSTWLYTRHSHIPQNVHLPGRLCMQTGVGWGGGEGVACHGVS